MIQNVYGIHQLSGHFILKVPLTNDNRCYEHVPDMSNMGYSYEPNSRQFYKPIY